MRNKLILLLLLIGQGCAPAFAEEEGHQDFVRVVAHAGASFAITTLSYGTYTALGMNKDNAIMLAILTAVAGGLVYKYVNGGNDYGVATIKNMVGIMPAVGAIKVFNW